MANNNERRGNARHIGPEQADRLFDDAFVDHALAELLDRFGSAFAEGLERQNGPITGEDIDRAIKEEDGEVGGEPLPQFSKEEDPFAGTSIDSTSVEATTTIAIEKMKKEMRKTVENCGKLLLEGNINEASQLVRTLTERMESAGKDALPEDMKAMYEDVRRNLDAAIKEKDPAAKSRLYKFACGAIDFIPVAGPAKMIIEAAAGRTLGGDRLKGWKRFSHMTQGVVFTMTDLTCFGVVAKKLKDAGKLAHLAPRLLTRSGAIMRVLGMPRAMYSPIFKAGRSLFQHPELASVASRGLIRTFELRKAEGVAHLLKILKSDGKLPENDVEVGNVLDRPGMSLDDKSEAEEGEWEEAA